MVQSAAKTVDEYLEELPPNRRDAVERFRAMARRTLPGFEESMMYGMPYYRRGGSTGIGFASQRQYISLNPGPKVIAAHRQKLARNMAGKGCVRFTDPEKIDWALIESLLKAGAT